MSAMNTATREQAAELWLYRRLGEILGPDRRGLAAYGLRFDPSKKQQYIGVDFEPGISTNILDRIPRNVGDVDVRVRRISLQLESSER
jgi:hypothetical protein